MTCGIYKIVNLINKKIYIGSSVKIEKRWREHINALRKGCHENILLQRNFNKYKEKNFLFKIVKRVPKSHLCRFERKYIKLYKTLDRNKGMNIASKFVRGGDTLANHPDKEKILKLRGLNFLGKRNPMYGKLGYWKGKKIPKKIILKTIKIKRKNGTLKQYGKDNPNFGNKWSDHQKKQQSKTISKLYKNGYKHPQLGTHLSKEQKRKLMKSIENRNYLGKNNPFYGKHHSKSTIEKIRKIHAGKYFGTQNKPFKIDKIKYQSLSDASKKLKISIPTICWRLRSKNKRFDQYKYI
jgi:group I intron endonuclease